MLLVIFFSTMLSIGQPFAASLPVRSQSMMASATAQGHSVGGIILDTSRRPLDNLQVELLDDVESPIRRVRTDGTGRYVFTGLTTGTFYIRVLTFGTNFVSQTLRITISSLSATSSGRSYQDYSFVLKTVDEEKGRESPKSLSLVFSQEVPEEARKIYDEAIEKLDAGKDAAGGVEGLKRAIEIFPDFYLALERLGLEYVKQQKYDHALEVLHRAVEVNSKGHMSFYGLGVAQYNLKRTEESLDALRQAVSLVPNSANSQFWLGIVLFRSGKPTEAEEPFKRAYQLAGKLLPDVHMYLAQIYSNTSRYKEAADELELFLKEAPNARDSENIKNIIAQLREKARKQKK
ncbi:MAG: tetratricopeptide repeat protein [Blastocatellia bacterium]|nr:tetratricopeptide repeat protein [Blastocatellia bacterium]